MGSGTAGALQLLGPNARPGDRVTVLGSTDVDRRFYDALLKAATDLGLTSRLVLIPPLAASGGEAPNGLEVLRDQADLLLLAPSLSLGHSHLVSAFLKEGGRCLTFPVPPGADQALRVLAEQAAYGEERISRIRGISKELGGILDAAKNVCVTSSLGSDLRLSVDGRRSHIWYGVAEEDVWNYTCWPPGDAHVSVREDSAEGTLVVDGYVSGRGVPKHAIILHVAKGVVTRIEGGDEAREITALLDGAEGASRTLAEFGFGTDPWAVKTGANGDKYQLGTAHIALGKNASPCFGGWDFDGHSESSIHLDMVLQEGVRVEAEGRVVIENGELLV